MKRSMMLVALLGAGLAACVAPTEPTKPGAPDSSPLAFTERTADSVVGTYTLDSMVVEFSSQLDQGVFAVEVTFNGLTLTADYDSDSDSAALDGYATDDGADTTLTDEDKLVIAELGKALADAKVHEVSRTVDPETERGVVVHEAGDVLFRALSIWNLTEVSQPLTREITAEVGRTINYLCGYLSGMGYPATHDCCTGGVWGVFGSCTDRWDYWHYINVGPVWDWSQNNWDNAAVCYSDANGCGSGNGGWQYGDWYGACTALSDVSRIYVIDCNDHDHCVRNHDHMLGSGWCSDEAASASDDQLGGGSCPVLNGCAGRCGGYGANGGCWCDSYCGSYGDCCSDKAAYCGG